MSQFHTRYRPHLEECESRLVPSGGDWHAIVQSGKALDQATRQDPAIAAALTDPFCNGTDPGPCAMPDIVRLRANLYSLENDIYQRYLSWNGAAFDTQQHLNQLIGNGAPIGQWWPVQLEHDYEQARWAQASNDASDISAVERTPDNQLVAWADGVWTRWWNAAKYDAQVETQAKKDLRRAETARPPDTNGILANERRIAQWSG